MDWFALQTPGACTRISPSGGEDSSILVPPVGDHVGALYVALRVKRPVSMFRFD